MATSVHKLKAAPQPKAQADPPEASVWRVYEREKSIIANDAQSVDEYEIRVKALAKRLGL